MYVTDLAGKKIKITNRHAAIDQANIFIGYFETDEHFHDFEEGQKTYWRDIIRQLQELAKLN
jgi:protein involved in temperature-dependent protein secretion